MPTSLNNSAVVDRWVPIGDDFEAQEIFDDTQGEYVPTGWHKFIHQDWPMWNSAQKLMMIGPHLEPVPYQTFGNKLLRRRPFGSLRTWIDAIRRF